MPSHYKTRKSGAKCGHMKPKEGVVKIAPRPKKTAKSK